MLVMLMCLVQLLITIPLDLHMPITPVSILRYKLETSIQPQVWAHPSLQVSWNLKEYSEVMKRINHSYWPSLCILEPCGFPEGQVYHSSSRTAAFLTFCHISLSTSAKSVVLWLSIGFLSYHELKSLLFTLSSVWESILHTPACEITGCVVLYLGSCQEVSYAISCAVMNILGMRKLLWLNSHWRISYFHFSLMLQLNFSNSFQLWHHTSHTCP